MNKVREIQSEKGAEFFQTDSKMIYGAYFCEQTDDGNYKAKMYGCNGLVDNQSQFPVQQYESRYEIRKNLAHLLEAISEDAEPLSKKEETVIRMTRQQLDDLLLLLNNDEFALPNLLRSE